MSRPTLNEYIQQRIKRQEDLLDSSSENTKDWREIIISELKEVLSRLPATPTQEPK